MTLISSENSIGRNIGGAVVMLALSPAILLMALVALLLKPFVRPLEMTAEEAAASLRSIIEGTGGEWAYDDFTSIKLADPQLESIRKRAARIDEPLTADGIILLRSLLSEAEAMAGSGGAPD